MDTIIEIMLPAFVACLILTGIHTYLGLHVVSRGVIFVDLALAQIAALGSTFAFLLGFDPKSTEGYLYSLGFAFIGAAIFSLSRFKDNRIPQEAIIGITFAVASSAAILIAERAPQGAEHVEEMLTGAILWVEPHTIWKTFWIYSAVGVFHFVFRKKFLLISMDLEQAERQGIAVRWWDFLFYMSFGFVITSSVAIAGVLLVFSFLIIPSVIGMLFSNKIGTRLIVGWISGTLVSLVGLLLSYRLDLASGPAVVSTFGAFLIAAALVQYVARAPKLFPAVGRVAAGGLGLALLLTLALQFRPSGVESAADPQSELEQIQHAAQALAGETEPDESSLRTLVDHRDSLVKAIRHGDVTLGQRALQRIGDSGRSELIPVLEETFEFSRDDGWRQYYAALAETRLGDKRGIHNMILLLKIEEPIFLKNQAIAEIRKITGRDFGYDPTLDASANEAAINQAEVWWHQNTDRLSWDPESRDFTLSP